MKQIHAINETFTSLQGESTFMGLPCFFIRLVGCNLKCSYCDTQYACSEQAESTNYTTDELIHLALQSGTQLVEITGGEPLIHDLTPSLAQALLDRHFTVLIETNGSQPIKKLPKEVIKIMDIKTPSSGMHAYNLWENIAHLSNQDEVKFVIQNRLDFDYACQITEQYALTSCVKAVHFSPNASCLLPAKLATWILSQPNSLIRLHLQQHKIIWPCSERGV